MGEKFELLLIIFALYSWLMVDSNTELIAFVKYRMEILFYIRHILCHTNEYHWVRKVKLSL
jgi:hypothetical protein